MSPGILSLSAGPAASDIMIDRYGIPAEDVQRYKRDHRDLVASALFAGGVGGLLVGAALAGFLYLVDFGITFVEDLLFLILVCALIFDLLSLVLWRSFSKGVQA